MYLRLLIGASDTAKRLPDLHLNDEDRKGKKGKSVSLDPKRKPDITPMLLMIKLVLFFVFYFVLFFQYCTWTWWFPRDPSNNEYFCIHTEIWSLPSFWRYQLVWATMKTAQCKINIRLQQISQKRPGSDGSASHVTFTLQWTMPNDKVQNIARETIFLIFHIFFFPGGFHSGCLRIGIAGCYR